MKREKETEKRAGKEEKGKIIEENIEGKREQKNANVCYIFNLLNIYTPPLWRQE